MPTIIMANLKSVEPTLKKKTMAFLEKLSQNDNTAGLHIEPIAGSVDARVRTGRVDIQYRAVLFRLAGTSSVSYVFCGVWNHDDAIELAKRSTLDQNPVNGVTEVKLAEPGTVAADIAGAGTPLGSTAAAAAARAVTAAPTHRSGLLANGWNAAELVSQIGIDRPLAERAMAAADDDQLQDVVSSALVQWQALALIDLAAGTSLSEVKASLGLDEPAVAGTPDESADDRLLRGMQTPAARLQFAWTESTDELRRAIDEGDFGAWRVFLHPEQRRFVDQRYTGPARLAGGAGTGKTVVVVHRAARLAAGRPTPRVLLTTFTTNLAQDLDRDVSRLDPSVPRAGKLGEPGLYVKGIDALVWAVLVAAESGHVQAAMVKSLGAAVAEVTKRRDPGDWRAAIDDAGAELPDALRAPAFFEAEYAAVILPQCITTADAYYRARRQGRGVALDRAKRAAVWAVVDNYRTRGHIDGTMDFAEAATVAAQWATSNSEAGHGWLFDHVLVDEAQDLTPSHLLLLRAMVAPGPDDLFLSEDSHQRIYGQKVTLSRYGIKVVGRSRKLRLNYRTTAQNLDWAMTVLDGGSFSDLDDEPETHDYRSARSGPRPRMLPGASLADELDAAADCLKGWLANSDGPDPENIAILVRDKFQRERVVAGLTERGIDVR
ncbi:MAG: UvrD-helicase domain-containing protein, partial [Actinomycetota bacterium]|nr:UvrD-helicase domain-containing protein [Actinomycetota bacterium]